MHFVCAQYIMALFIVCFTQPAAAMTQNTLSASTRSSWTSHAQTWRNVCSDYQQELASHAPALLQLAQERHPTGCAFLDTCFALQPHEYATQLASCSLEILYEGLRLADYLDLRGGFIAHLTRYCATRFWQKPEQALALLARTSDHVINQRLRENMFQLDTTFIASTPPLYLQYSEFYSGVTDVVWSHDDRTVVVVNMRQNCFWLWDLATGISHTAQCSAHVFSVAFNHDSSLLIIALGDHTARIIDTATYRQRSCLKGHRNCVRAAEFNHNSTALITASNDAARIWYIGKEGRQATTRHILADQTTKSVLSAHFNQDGSLAVTLSYGFVHFWNVETGQKIGVIALDNYRSKFTWIGTHVAFNSYSRNIHDTISLFQVSIGELLHTFSYGATAGPCQAIAFSGTNMHCSCKHELHVWDTTNVSLPPFSYRFPFVAYATSFNKHCTHIAADILGDMIYVVPIKAPPCSLEQALVIARLLQEPENHRTAFLRAPEHAGLRAHFDTLDPAWHTILTPRYKITQAVLHLWAFIIWCIRSCFLAKNITIPA